MFAGLKSQIAKELISPDAFGLNPRAGLFGNVDWRHLSTDTKLQRFLDWFKEAVDGQILHRRRNFARAIEQAYKKGVLASWHKIRVDEFMKTMGMTAAQKNEFVRILMQGNIGKQALGTLITQFNANLEGITGQLASRLGNKLVEGLVKGWKPRTLQREMNKLIKEAAERRAKILAHDAAVRAQADGVLDALDTLGVKRVTAKVEFKSMEDDKVCPVCESLNGQIFTIADARGVIPVHIFCRCTWIPVRD